MPPGKKNQPKKVETPSIKQAPTKVQKPKVKVQKPVIRKPEAPKKGDKDFPGSDW